MQGRYVRYVLATAATAAVTVMICVPCLRAVDAYLIASFPHAGIIEPLTKWQYHVDAVLFIVFGSALPVLVLLLREQLLRNREERESERQRITNELNFLKQQLNPHFLFNVINSIFNLIDEDPDQAKEYLAEPTTFARYLRAVNKAHDYHQLRTAETDTTPAPAREYIFVKCEGRHEKIDFDALLYVEAMQNYSIFHTTAGRYVSLMPLRAAAELLPPARFLRSHKSYVVAMDRIDSIDGNSVNIGGKNIPIGRAQRRDLLGSV